MHKPNSHHAAQKSLGVSGVAVAAALSTLSPSPSLGEGNVLEESHGAWGSLALPRALEERLKLKTFAPASGRCLTKEELEGAESQMTLSVERAALTFRRPADAGMQKLITQVSSNPPTLKSLARSTIPHPDPAETNVECRIAPQSDAQLFYRVMLGVHEKKAQGDPVPEGNDREELWRIITEMQRWSKEVGHRALHRLLQPSVERGRDEAVKTLWQRVSSEALAHLFDRTVLERILSSGGQNASVAVQLQTSLLEDCVKRLGERHPRGPTGATGMVPMEFVDPLCKSLIRKGALLPASERAKTWSAETGRACPSLDTFSRDVRGGTAAALRAASNVVGHLECGAVDSSGASLVHGWKIDSRALYPFAIWALRQQDKPSAQRFCRVMMALAEKKGLGGKMPSGYEAQCLSGVVRAMRDWKRGGLQQVFCSSSKNGSLQRWLDELMTLTPTEMAARLWDSDFTVEIKELYEEIKDDKGLLLGQFLWPRTYPLSSSV